MIYLGKLPFCKNPPVLCSFSAFEETFIVRSVKSQPPPTMPTSQESHIGLLRDLRTSPEKMRAVKAVVQQVQENAPCLIGFLRGPRGGGSQGEGVTGEPCKFLGKIGEP